MEERLREQLETVQRAAGEADVPALLSALESESPRVKIAAIEALGRTGGDKASLALSRIARERYGQRPEVRIVALAALGWIYEPERYPDFLESYISEENRKVVAGARKLLERADPRGFPGRLARRGCLDQPAIRVYGKARLSEAVPLLAAFVKDRVADGSFASGAYWGKVCSAARALGAIGGDDARMALEGLIEAAESSGAGGFLEKERLEKIRQGAASALASAKEGEDGAEIKPG